MAFAITAWLTVSLTSQTRDVFRLPPKCVLPFDRIATKPDPLGSCGIDGAAGDGKASGPSKVQENNSKNNFCADATNVTTVDFKILQQMQAYAPPKVSLSASRDSLRSFFPVAGKKIGEGSVVRLLAFVKEAHISDCMYGESVNCRATGMQGNDFHISLVDPSQQNPRSADLCTGVVAEISPHFRPAAWSQIDLKTPMNAVRFIGPLFYDDAHEPCVVKNGRLTGPGPQRISLWEIHPIYAIDVCTASDVRKCDVERAAGWIPYDQWVDSNNARVEATGRKQREACDAGSLRKPVVRRR